MPHDIRNYLQFTNLNYQQSTIAHKDFLIIYKNTKLEIHSFVRSIGHLFIRSFFLSGTHS